MHFWPLKNIVLGVSIENQKAADKRIPILLQIPAAVRVVSCEPLLSDIDLGIDIGQGVGDLAVDRLDWVIVGGESGPGARPMHPDWVRSIRDQCQGAGVPFFFKQWGEYRESIPSNESSANHHIYAHNTSFYRAGKKQAGRMFDGGTWNEYPDLIKELEV